MTSLRKKSYFKIISAVLVALFLYQADLLYALSQGEKLDLQFSRAKNEYSAGKYGDAVKRLARLETAFENLKDRTADMEYKYGQVLLLLGACCEKSKLKPLKNTAEVKYRLAKEKLGANFSIPGLELGDLKIYTKIMNGELKIYSDNEKGIEQEKSRDILNKNLDKLSNLGKVIEQEKASGPRTKRFPWLIIGAVVVAGVIAYFLLAKKPKLPLTVSVDEGVEGTPASGTTLYKKGSTVNYSYTLKSGYNALVVKLDGADVAASGTIKMDKNHTLTAAASKQYTLTVTRGVGVAGSPETGPFLYNEGETVNYSYTLQNGYTNLSVKIDGVDASPSGTITMNGNHTISATAGKVYKLTVTRGIGVNGLPDTGTYNYQESNNVNYSYSLQSGYDNLVVTLDGIPISAIGTITMDKDHILSATSGKTYTLTVSKGVGVDGMPEGSALTFREGELVNYSYSLKTGYKDLLVTLDGTAVAATGTITMDKNHILIASSTALNEYRLTVTKGTGVTGTPDNGMQNYIEGSTVSYSYNLQDGYKDLTITIDGVSGKPASGTITMNANHTMVVTATAIKKYTLTVTKGDGVVGAPDGGATQYDEGSTVTYSYSLQSGYTDLVVRLDGNTVAANGSIAMNSDHVLVATAGKTYVLTVSRGTGVDGTPVTGGVQYTENQVVPYNYSLKDGYMNLVVTIDGNTASASGSITMDKDHTLTATAQKKWTLTVTRNAGINGTPVSGTYDYPEGNSVSYGYSVKTGYQDLVVKVDGAVKLTNGTIIMDKDHTLIASATKVWTLTVTKGTGVNGNPDTGTYTFANGDSTTYSYSLQGGYTNLVVTLDGNPVAASGNITMNSAHALTATATATFAAEKNEKLE